MAEILQITSYGYTYKQWLLSFLLVIGIIMLWKLVNNEKATVIVKRILMVIVILLPYSIVCLLQMGGFLDVWGLLTNSSKWVRVLTVLPVLVYIFLCLLSTILLLSKWEEELCAPAIAALERKLPDFEKQSGVIRSIVAVIFLPSYLLVIVVSILIHFPIYNWMVSLEDKEAVGGFVKTLYLIVAGICVVVTIYLVIRSFWRGKTNSHSILLPYDEYPQLYQLIYKVCERIKATPPNQVVLEWSANFYVTESTMINFKHILRKRTLCISAPLLSILKPEEFLAIIAHEMAHFSGRDTLYGKLFYPVYRGLESSLGTYATALYATRNIIGYLGHLFLALFVPAIFLFLFYNTFKFAEKWIGRQRELRADGIAAVLTNAEYMGTALVKSIIGIKTWNKTYSEWSENIAVGIKGDDVLSSFLQKFPTTATERYDVLMDGKKYQFIEELDENLSPRPFDTHPTIHKRMLNLGLDQWHKQTYYDADGMWHGSLELSLDINPSRNAQIFIPEYFTKFSELNRLEEEFIKKKYNK